MGGAFSGAFVQLKRIANRFNAENRALKFIEKGEIKPAPRHISVDPDRILEEKPHLKKELEDLHKKNENLDGYLKKVYLTSTAGGTTPESNRKLPVLTVKTLDKMFFEPETPTPGFCTLSNVVEMMIKYQEDPSYWNAKALAKHYNMSVSSIVHLLTYYSLFKMEKFDSLNQEPDEVKEKKEIKFEVYTPLEKKPLRQIEGKK